jgi:hypothetical protein
MLVFPLMASPLPVAAEENHTIPGTARAAAAEPAENKSEKDEAPAADGEEGEEEKNGPQFMFRGMVKNLYSFHRTNHYVGKDMANSYISNSFLGTDRHTLTTKNLSADLTRLRLSPEFRYGEILTMKTDLDSEIILSDYGMTTDFTSSWRPSQYNDFLRLSWEPYQDKNLYYRIKVHQIYAKLNVDKFTATAGRQQIRFGSGRLWNPLDILNPISPTFLEGADEQKGTDAVKFDFFPDQKTVVTAIMDFKKSNDSIRHFNMRDCNYIARVKATVETIDIAMLGAYVARRGIAGFDIASFLFEGVLRGSVIICKADSRPAYLQANVGYEYNFKKGVYLLVEYFYNQNAISHNRKIWGALYLSQANAMNQDAYLQLANQFLTINQHYAGAAIGYDFHPLVRGELFMIGDIQGRSVFFGPTLKINAYENLDFTIGLMGALSFDDRSSDFSEYRKHYQYYASGSYFF